MPRYILTGAPGTGKTTLLSALGNHVATVTEPAREVLAEHAHVSSQRLDTQPELFVMKLLERSLEDFRGVDHNEDTIFDRGLPDVVAYATVSNVDAGEPVKAAQTHRYQPNVFIAPLWEEIYTTDDLRDASFEQVSIFDTHLRRAYLSLGYQLVELPLAPVGERVDFILTNIQAI